MTDSFLPLQRKLIWLIVLFLLLGQIVLFSATGVLGLQRYQSEFYYVLRQASAAVAGLALMFLISRFRYQYFRKLAFAILALQLILVGATFFGSFGHVAGGATRWLRVGSFVFQPSELAKISVVIYVSHLLATHKQSPLKVRKWLVLFAPVLVLLFAILRQPDLGTTVLLTVTMVGLFFIAGMKLSYLVAALGVGGVGFALSMLHSDYRRRRLFAFLNPWADPQGNGFQTIQSFLSLHSGKLFGTGIGNGNSKLFYLPEVHTDFIYALIGEELGFVGAISLLMLFIYFSYLLFKIALQAKDPFGCYLAFGLALSLTLQIAVNLGGVTGILPVKGLPLPFISWGRSALIVNLIMVGILLNIVRQSAIISPSKNKST